MKTVLGPPSERQDGIATSREAQADGPTRGETLRPTGQEPGRRRVGVREEGPSVDSGYWLSHCEGFRVDAPGGLLGFVERVVLAESGYEPEALVVLGGLSGRQRWLVHVDDVAVVQPNRECVSLDSSPAELRLFADGGAGSN